MSVTSECRDELAALSQRLLSTCQTRAYTGITLYTPDAVASYNALWGRDFAYMCEYAGQFIPDGHIIDCVDYLVNHAREDGWIPDRVYGDGTVAYAAGATGHPIGEANLDTAPFMVFAMDTVLRRLPSDKRAALLRRWSPAVEKAWRALPMDECGLVRNPQDKPHSPYGFTDIVRKTGLLFIESLLVWRGSRMMEHLLDEASLQGAEWYSACARAIESGIYALWNADAGMFYAADGDCKQIDIWGNAYARAIGFPLDAAHGNAIEDYLAAHYDGVVQDGQIRHLPEGDYWQSLLIGEDEGHYQNGAYWATASGWMYKALLPRYPQLAERLLTDVARYFRDEGAYECVNGPYKKLRHFVVSATNVLGAL